jgi:hypothetical protein
MGSTTILDILGSTITFGLLLIISLRLNASASESNSTYYANYMLQSNMLTLTVMLEDDLKHVGSWYAPTVADPTAIRVAASNEFSFFRNGVLVDWRVGDPSEIPETQNPNDRYIYRTENNGVPNKLNLGATLMTFTYWNISDPTIIEPAPVPHSRFGNIGPIDISIQLESPYKRTQQYTNDTSRYEMSWRQIRSIARSTLVQIPQ